MNGRKCTPFLEGELPDLSRSQKVQAWNEMYTGPEEGKETDMERLKDKNITDGSKNGNSRGRERSRRYRGKRRSRRHRGKSEVEKKMHKLQHHGHGTLGSEDVRDATEVNVETIDCTCKNLKTTFGELGGLPQDSKRVPVVSETLKLSLKNGTKTVSVKLEPGKYILYIVLLPSPFLLSRWLLSRFQHLHVRSFLIGAGKSFSHFRTETELNKRRDIVRLRFEVMEQDCKKDVDGNNNEAELQTIFSSESRYSNTRFAFSIVENN